MAETVSPELNVIWRPRSEPQKALIACPIFEVFFGGARGSLKTDSVLADWISHAAQYKDKAFGLMVRRTREELLETFERAKEIYTPLGFKFSGYVCRSPDGARFTFAYLDNDSDADRYQGWNLTRVYVEEIGNFPSPTPIMKLMATLRSPHGVPCCFRATGNPGGVGHLWVKRRYIDPAPGGWEPIDETFTNPFTGEEVVRQRVFIPGKISDHDLLGLEYVANLQMSGSENLVKAWLLGDWDIIEGAFFDCWDASKHVVKPFPIPKEWTRFTSFDWGGASPFSVGWWAISDGSMPGIAAGCLIRYAEWYGAKRDRNGLVIPNEGLRLSNAEIAEGIAEREAKMGDPITYRVADPSIFIESGGPSIHEQMYRATKQNWKRGDNKRVPGWAQVRQRLIGQDGRPMMIIFNTCTELIRTLPALPHDEHRPEEVDTDSEDHAGDEARYACMSRPWHKPKDPFEPRKWQADQTMNEMISELTRRGNREERI